MAQTDQKQSWRSRLGWLTGQLFVIFLGVSAAFVVENYRETLSQKEELHQAVAGIITEMEHYEKRSVQFADAFNAATERWGRRTGKDGGPSPVTTEFQGGPSADGGLEHGGHIRHCAYARAETANGAGLLL